MKRKGFVESEFFVVLILLGFILAMSLSIINGAKRFAIAEHYHPASFALPCLIAFWGFWVGACYVVATLSHWLKWPWWL